MIYLDYAATAPLSPTAIDAMAGAARGWANPSSVHAPGRAARAALEEARGAIGAALGFHGSVILTSGGTEALGIALRQARAAVRMVSASEHAAVLGQAPGAAVIPVNADGQVRLDRLEAMLGEADGPALVAVMHANNETGTVQPLPEVIRLTRARGGLVLADCVQSAGKLPLPDADLIAVSAHKLGGPAGAGALLVRDPACLQPAPPAGGQERGFRPGTENWLGAIGFAAAAQARAADTGWTERAAGLREAIEAAAVAAGGEVIAAHAPRLPTIACLRLPGVDAMLQLMQLDLAGFAVSAGAACSSGKVKGSHVLRAMGLGAEAAGEAIRVSVGWNTTAAECDAFGRAYGDMARAMLRKAA